MTIGTNLTPTPPQPPQTPEDPRRQQRPRVVDALPWRHEDGTGFVLVLAANDVESRAIERGGFKQGVEVGGQVGDAGGAAGHRAQHVGDDGVVAEDGGKERDGGGEALCVGGWMELERVGLLDRLIGEMNLWDWFGEGRSGRGKDTGGGI